MPRAVGVPDPAAVTHAVILAELDKFVADNPDVADTLWAGDVLLKRNSLEFIAGDVLDTAGGETYRLLRNLHRAGDVLRENGIPVTGFLLLAWVISWTAARDRATPGSVRIEALTTPAPMFLLGLDDLEREYRNRLTVDALAQELVLPKDAECPYRFDEAAVLQMLRSVRAIHGEHPDAQPAEIAAAAGLEALLGFVNDTPDIADFPLLWLYDAAVYMLDEKCQDRAKTLSARVWMGISDKKNRGHP